MAIQFIQKTSHQNKRTIYIGIALIFVIIWAVFFWNSKREGGLFLEISQEVAKVREQRIEINFNKLENEMLKALTPFKKIAPLTEFKEKAGRDNPFAPAPIATETPDREEIEDN